MAHRTSRLAGRTQLKSLVNDVTQQTAINSWAITGQQAKRNARKTAQIARQLRISLEQPQNLGNKSLAHALGYHNAMHLLLQGARNEQLFGKLVELAQDANASSQMGNAVIKGAMLALQSVKTLLEIYEAKKPRTRKLGACPLPTPAHMGADAAEGAPVLT